MQPKNTLASRHLFPAVILSALLSVIAPSAVAAQGLQLVLKHGGNAAGDYERTGVGLRFKPLWVHEGTGWDATLHPEVELSRFRYTGSHPGNDRLSQAGAIGLLRVQKRDGGLRPYAEIGLGAALFSGARLGRKDISTHFQFSQHLGFGLEFSGGWNLGLQYSHYSNADIKKPNDGLDLYQILFGKRF